MADNALQHYANALAYMDRLGAIGWPLAMCSVVALAVVLERLVFYARCVRKRHTLYQQLADTLRAHQHHDKAIRDEVVQLALLEAKQPYQRGIRLLRIIAIISPMLGLLGTVLGIIAAFEAIAVHAGPISPSIIADGIWQAMLTTAVGLMVALPALVVAHGCTMFNEHYFRGMAMRLNTLSLHLALPKASTNTDKA